MKKKIMIVEDHEATRKSLVEMFAGEYEVDSAKDGSEGLFKIMNTKYDLVITDNHMPYLSGVDMIEFYEDKNTFFNKNTAVIMITTDCDQKSKVRGKRAGVDYWMIKPFNLIQFYKACIKILDPHSSKFL